MITEEGRRRGTAPSVREGWASTEAAAGPSLVSRSRRLCLCLLASAPSSPGSQYVASAAPSREASRLGSQDAGLPLHPLAGNRSRGNSKCQVRPEAGIPQEAARTLTGLPPFKPRLHPRGSREPPAPGGEALGGGL